MHHDARQRIERVLRARGLLREPGDEPAPVKGAEDSLLPYLQAASVQTKVAAGENPGRSIPRLVDPSTTSSYRDLLELPRGALKAERDGYSLHAATCVAAGRRADLEDPHPDYPSARTVRRPVRDNHPEDPPVARPVRARHRDPRA